MSSTPTCTRFQDIHDLAQNIRRIGLGVMGWADMLVRLGSARMTPTEGVELRPQA